MHPRAPVDEAAISRHQRVSDALTRSCLWGLVAMPANPRCRCSYRAGRDLWPPSPPRSIYRIAGQPKYALEHLTRRAAAAPVGWALRHGACPDARSQTRRRSPELRHCPGADDWNGEDIRGNLSPFGAEVGAVKRKVMELPGPNFAIAQALWLAHDLGGQGGGRYRQLRRDFPADDRRPLPSGWWAERPMDQWGTHPPSPMN
jgi:hypothetical protein